MTVEKFRPDADPPTRWLRLANDPDSNLFALSAAGARPEHEADTPSEDERVAARIRALADQVRADVEAGGWPPGRIAAAVGRDPADGTFARALKLVQADGGWEATGATTSRRYRPSATLATLADPLRDGRNGESEAGAGCDRERGA